jgi:single-strand DNA-binding protein
MNSVFLAGRLGLEPELKYSQSGTAVLRLRMVTESWQKGRDGGEGQKVPQWHTVVLFGNRAEAMSKWLTKGHGVTVRGELRYREWENKDGVKITSAEIIADDIMPGAAPRGDKAPDRSQGARNGNGQQRQDNSGKGWPKDDFGNDDIPF